MNIFRFLLLPFFIAGLASCQKKDCNCAPPPQVDAPEDSWVLDGITYKAKGHAVKSRDGSVYLYTFVADTPAHNPSTLTLRFHGMPDNTNSFNIISPSYIPDSSSATMVAFRGYDSSTYTSLGTGQMVSAYLNTAFELTWVVNGIWLKGNTDTVRLSFNLSE